MSVFSWPWVHPGFETHVGFGISVTPGCSADMRNVDLPFLLEMIIIIPCLFFVFPPCMPQFGWRQIKAVPPAGLPRWDYFSKQRSKGKWEMLWTVACFSGQSVRWRRAQHGCAGRLCLVIDSSKTHMFMYGEYIVFLFYLFDLKISNTSNVWILSKISVWTVCFSSSFITHDIFWSFIDES